MKMCLDCITCVVGNVIHLAKEAVADPVQQEAMARELLDISAGVSWEVTPPEYASLLYGVLNKYTGCPDLFIKEKDQSTELAMRLLPDLRTELAKQPDYFEAVVRIVAGGNIIDYGVDRHFKLDTVRDRLLEVFHMPVDAAAVRRLRENLERAESILYILDNCGEAVLDKLLIEMFAPKVTLAVRGAPVFNDITRRELVSSGLAEYACIDTGDPTPGVSLTHAAPEFLRRMRASDLVLAKGQGNFETLTDYDRPIFHLLRAKCGIVIKFLGGVPHNSLQVIARNLPE